MKAGDVSIVQYDTEYGGFRVLPLRSVADIGRMEAARGERHSWIVVGYAGDEAQAYAKLEQIRAHMKEAEGE